MHPILIFFFFFFFLLCKIETTFMGGKVVQLIVGLITKIIVGPYLKLSN